MPEHSGEPSGLLAELSALELPRTTSARLSIETEYRPCVDSGAGLIVRAHCGAGPRAEPRLADLAARASAAIRTNADPATLQAVALIDLIVGGSANSLNRSIRLLENAVRLARDPAPVLSDLAAAHLVRAERDQSPRDLLEAIEAADRALEMDSTNLAARFNRSLASERLGLVKARVDWQGYAVLDSRSGWGDEARGRVAFLSRVRAPVLRPGENATAEELDAFASRAPQAALTLGWRALLGDWAQAWEAGDTVKADARLSAASAIGAVLATGAADVTLSHAVTVIESHRRDTRGLRALARAHRSFALGLVEAEAGRYQPAIPFFEAAAGVGSASPSLRAWATAYLGHVRVMVGEPVPAERLLRPLAASVDPLRQAALAGRVRSSLGTSYLRAGRYEPALRIYQQAADDYERVGDEENVASLLALVAQAQVALGDMAGAFVALQRALGALRTLGEPPRLHNVLYAFERAAAAEGLIRAATAIADDDVGVTSRANFALNAVEARLARARHLFTLGRVRRADEDRSAAYPQIAGLTDDARRWFSAHHQQVSAEARLASAPAAAAASLDSVEAFYEERGNALRLLPALFSRAEARVAAGDTALARSDLDRSVKLLAEQRDSIGRLEYRVSMMDAARRTFDRLIMLRLADGRPEEALGYLELGRASLSASRASWSRTAVGLNAVRIPASAGVAVVEYATVGDTLLTWVISDSAPVFSRVVIRRDSLTRLVQRVRTALELRSADASVGGDLVRLYDWLVRPIAPALGPDGRPIVVIADGEIAGVPFAALRDSSMQRYLVEAHPIRFESSWRDVVAPAVRRGGEESVMLVATPDVGSPSDGEMPLPDARDEISSLASIYTAATVLSGVAATRQAFLEGMGRSTLVHFAGHGVVDADRPERSHLVVAPVSPTEQQSGWVVPADFDGLDLRRVRLVVLSACETLQAREGRAGAVSGLASAMLGRGVGAVMGTDWRVDDRLTREFMVAFHRAYRGSGDGPRALQRVQVEMIRSADPALRTPAAWAAYRYAGT